MCFEVPESCRKYFTDAAVRTAVDHLLDKRQHRRLVPKCIEWDELPKFYRAILSAYQVRCEYAIFMNDIWDAVWKEALERCDIWGQCTPLSIAESQKRDGQKLDTYTIWDEEWFGRCFNITDTNFVLGIGMMVSINAIWLSFLFLDQGDEPDGYAGLDDFGDDWSEEIGDYGYRWSREFPSVRDKTIDLDGLRKAAADALCAIKRGPLSP